MGSGSIAPFVTTSKYANFASSLSVSGEETVITVIPSLLKENRRHGAERLMVNGRQLVLRTRYRNMLGVEKIFLRIKPNLINSLPIYSPLFNGMPMAMFAPSCGG